MKKLLILALTVGLVSGAVAQNSKVVSAYNYMNDNELLKAREAIDEAITHEKTKDNEKTWRYRGQIYSKLAVDSTQNAMDPKEAFEKAIQSYEKAMELDTKERYLKENKTGIAIVQNQAVNKGIEAYNARKFTKAVDYFLLGEEAAQDLGITDTLALYNAGLAAEQAGNMDVALQQYQKAADLGYEGPKMYLYMANIYQKQERPEEYLAIVKAGREKHPEDADLIVYELNYYLQNDKFEEAEENLKLAIKAEPNNKQLYFSLGVVYDQLNKDEQAIEAYQKAIELDPDYFDAIYNLGALYFNNAVEKKNEANALKSDAEFKKATDKANEIFRKAQPYLEKAHELQPDDPAAISSLKQLYVLLKENEKYEQLKARTE